LVDTAIAIQSLTMRQPPRDTDFPRSPGRPKRVREAARVTNLTAEIARWIFFEPIKPGTAQMPEYEI
jgi:hypothetical protein